jgi:hypothetical protein
MNLVDAYVTKVLSEPAFNDVYKDEGITWWQVSVEYDSYGWLSETLLTFKTKSEAEAVSVGYKFLT